MSFICKFPIAIMVAAQTPDQQAIKTFTLMFMSVLLYENIPKTNYTKDNRNNIFGYVFKSHFFIITYLSNENNQK